MKLTGIIESIFNGRCVLRGYAPIADLIEYSKANFNYQREVDDKHVKKLIEFLKGDNPYRFFTELLFGLEFSDPHAIGLLREKSISSPVNLSDDIKITELKLKSTTAQLTSFDDTDTIQKIICLEFNKDATKMSRIDGNHRLTAAETIFKLESSEENDRLKDNLQKMVVPFSILIQGNNNNPEDYEAAIFYLINSNSVPLTEEQNLKAIFESNRFTSSQLGQIFCIDNADLMTDIVDSLDKIKFTDSNVIFNEGYYTCIHQLTLALNSHKCKTDLNSIIAAFYKVADDLSVKDFLKNCRNINIIAAMIYISCTENKLYSQFLLWLEATRIYSMEEVQVETIISLFDKAMNAQIKIFVAMPYYSQDVIRSTNDIYNRIINKYREKYHIDISLPGGIMTYEGSTINIINDIFNRIENCDVCFCDITGNNPNVTYEMGWARALRKYVVILKEENADGSKSDYRMDFYSTFKKDAYITLEEAIEKNLRAILKKYYSINIIDNI